MQAIPAPAETAAARDSLRRITVTVAENEAAEVHGVTEKEALVCRCGADQFLTGIGAAT